MRMAIPRRCTAIAFVAGIAVLRPADKREQQEEDERRGCAGFEAFEHLVLRPILIVGGGLQQLFVRALAPGATAQLATEVAHQTE
jgi:hypothetical protein